MSNQTLVQIPLDTTTDPERLRIFLLRLIEKLDVVLGYRGNDGYVSQSELARTDQEINIADLTLIGLAQEIQRLFEITTANTEAISDNSDNIEEIQQGTSVADLSFTQVTPSAGYVQSEAQDVADQAKNAGDKIDELLAILRTAGIIS